MQSTGNSPELGILLDLDGTIVNSMVPLKETFISISSMLGVIIDDEKQRRIGRELRTVVGGRPTKFSELKFIWRIGRILEMPWWKKILLILMSHFRLKQTANLAPAVEGVIEAVRHLKKDQKVKLGLVTSRSKKDVIKKLSNLELLDYFDVLVTRDDVQNFKPSPEQIRLAADVLNMPIERCVLVGDMPTDIDAAKEIGALSIGVSTGIFFEEVKARKPDIIIRSVADLPNSLDNIMNKLNGQKNRKSQTQGF